MSDDSHRSDILHRAGKHRNISQINAEAAHTENKIKPIMITLDMRLFRVFLFEGINIKDLNSSKTGRTILYYKLWKLAICLLWVSVFPIPHHVSYLLIFSLQDCYFGVHPFPLHFPVYEEVNLSVHLRVAVLFSYRL